MKLIKREDGTYLLDGEGHTVLNVKSGEEWLETNLPLEKLEVNNFRINYEKDEEEIDIMIDKMVEAAHDKNHEASALILIKKLQE